MQSRAYPIKSFFEYIRAINLVYRRYVKQGYMKSNPSALRFLVRDTFPTSVVLSVKGADGETIGTITPYMSELGNLSEGHFFENELKCCGNYSDMVVEGTKFSVAESNGRPDLHTARLLIKGFFSLSYKQNAESIFMVVNPKHVSFWEQVVNFRAVSRSKEFPGVCGHPGVLMQIPVKKIKEGIYILSRSARRMLLEDDLPANEVLANYMFSEEEVLMLALSSPESVDDMSSFERKELEYYYPRVAQLVFHSVVLNDGELLYSEGFPLNFPLKQELSSPIRARLSDLLDKIMTLLQIRAEGQGVNLIYEVGKEFSSNIVAESMRLTHMLMSQLMTAIDYSCSGDTVGIFVTQEKRKPSDRWVAENGVAAKEVMSFLVCCSSNIEFELFAKAWHVCEQKFGDDSCRIGTSKFQIRAELEQDYVDGMPTRLKILYSAILHDKHPSMPNSLEYYYSINRAALPNIAED